jgi:quinol monooxygenase YgiN
MTNGTTGTAFYVRHKARPGKRDDLRKVWEKYARDYIATAAVQLAYFYCTDDKDPDVIVAFQLCTDRAGVDDFVKQPGSATMKRKRQGCLPNPRSTERSHRSGPRALPAEVV